MAQVGDFSVLSTETVHKLEEVIPELIPESQTEVLIRTLRLWKADIEARKESGIGVDSLDEKGLTEINRILVGVQSPLKGKSQEEL